jgi:hypothetical protein
MKVEECDEHRKNVQLGAGKKGKRKGKGSKE